MRVNYTTYDLRRSQDSLNSRTHADIMVLSHEDQGTGQTRAHPYWYARIIGIFHAMVQHTGRHSQSSEPQHMSFLWVRWYGRDLKHRAGWNANDCIVSGLWIAMILLHLDFWILNRSSVGCTLFLHFLMVVQVTYYSKIPLHDRLLSGVRTEILLRWNVSSLSTR